MTGMKLPDDFPQHVRHLSSLQQLDLTNTNLSDAAIQDIGCPFPNLEIVSLDECDITDTGVERLCGCARLQQLSVRNTMVRGRCLVQVLSECVWAIRLDGSPIDADEISALSKLSSIEILSLIAIDVDDDILSSLQHVPAKNLDLSKTNLGDAGFRRLLNNQVLESVGADGCDLKESTWAAGKEAGVLRFFGDEGEK